MTGAALRLIFPHQLFTEHLDAGDSTVMVLIEHDLLLRQYAFHSHKLVLHRASMDAFARRLRDKGFETEVLRSSAEQSSRAQLAALVARRAPSSVTWFDPVDEWLERDIHSALRDGGYETHQDDELETPNFLTTRADIDDWFGRHGARMQEFYIWQRRRLGILVDDEGRPAGGAWSYDAENRKKLPRGYTPPIPGRFGAVTALHEGDGMLDLDKLGDESRDTDRDPDVVAAIAWVRAEFPDAPGDPELFTWPTTPEEARAHLAEFVADRLADFGPYEDAVSATHPFIDHSLISAALNIGLLDPRQVVRAVLDGVGSHTPLASIEGFVRQVIGWREYMRATYRVRGTELRTSNVLAHSNRLGEGWWDARTGLAPVDLVISRVLRTGYAHHIERLMVLGNAMSLLRVHPDDVYRWFMEMFIDAYDWVMVPNVYAMSQFAAGEAITTKPYVSGSNYLRKMSDLPHGEWEGDWDALYWTFVDDHRDVFAQNPRSRMIARLLDQMDPDKIASHRERAAAVMSRSAAVSLPRG